jgi:hypothetical protein
VLWEFLNFICKLDIGLAQLLEDDDQDLEDGKIQPLALFFACIQRTGDDESVFTYYEVHRCLGALVNWWEFHRVADDDGVTDNEDLGVMIEENVKCAGCGVVYVVSILARGRRRERLVYGDEKVSDERRSGLDSFHLADDGSSGSASSRERPDWRRGMRVVEKRTQGISKISMFAI